MTLTPRRPRSHLRTMLLPEVSSRAEAVEDTEITATSAAPTTARTDNYHADAHSTQAPGDPEASRHPVVPRRSRLPLPPPHSNRPPHPRLQDPAVEVAAALITARQARTGTASARPGEPDRPEQRSRARRARAAATRSKWRLRVGDRRPTGRHRRGEPDRGHNLHAAGDRFVMMFALLSGSPHAASLA